VTPKRVRSVATPEGNNGYGQHHN